MKKILITGAAGFIGSSLADRLLARGDRVIGLDNLSPQYDPQIKLTNIKEASSSNLYNFYEADITDTVAISSLFIKEAPDCVVHIAGRTGMKASIGNPEPFFHANVSGTLSVLQACRSAGVKHFIYASSGSVYGTVGEPVTERHLLPAPSNPYAATKIIGERLTQSFSELCGMDTTILRIFTVYGPRQRAEMAIHRFICQIANREPVELYGNGSDLRDYLYIDNCVDAIVRAIDRPFRFEIFNIGEQRTISLNDAVSLLSCTVNVEASVKYIPAPEGIPRATFADIGKASRLLGYTPGVSLEDGFARFAAWLRNNNTII